MTLERKAVGAGLSMHTHFSSNTVDEQTSVFHVLADGRRVDSIDGFTIPNTGTTAAVYKLAAGLAKRKEGSYG